VDNAAPAGLRRFVIRVLDSGGTAGLGVLISDRAILTCAHVVNKALGRDLREPRKPDNDAVVEVVFPLLSGVDWRGQARIERWLAPPPQEGGVGADLAGLMLTSGLPEGAGPARLARRALPGGIADLFGYPRARPHGGWVEAVVRSEVEGGRLQLDTTERGALHVQPGYSGSPVCDRRSGHVVGLLWMAPRAGSDERDSYAIPVEQLRSAWPEVLADGGQAPGVVPADLFGTDWALLADDVQDYSEYATDPLVGREWLAAEIDTFCRERDRGYFVIEGDAGMGKTAFAAWLSRQRQCAAHFSQLDQDAGTTEVAARNLGAQLVSAWGLDDFAPGGALPKEAGSAGWLRSVVRAAARRRDQIAPGSPIVLVVDALDAAASDPKGYLPLGLPYTSQLPTGVYIVVTARTGGLQYSPEGCVRRSLDGARNENLADMREYLAWCVNRDYIAIAIANAGLSSQEFTDLLLDRSLGVWIYVRYVLEEIGEYPRALSELPRLPRGLQAWYHNNLARLCSGPDGTSLYLPLLATLAIAAEPLDAPNLAVLAGIGDQLLLEQVLNDRLRPYCSVRHLAGERRRFELRHPSLSEYLTGSFRSPAAEPEETADDTPIASVSDLREVLAEACRDAHDRVCDRYLTAWGGLDGHLQDLAADPRLGEMDRGYALRWLTWHLLAAGREGDLRELLACSSQGHNVWFEAHDYAGDVTGYLRDIGKARSSAKRLGSQLRYALIEASIASMSTTLPPALLGELVAKRLWTASRAFSFIERMADEKLQAQALARLACELPEELLGRALAIALKCRSPSNSAIALEALIPRLPGDSLGRSLDAVLGIMTHSPDASLGCLTALAAKLPREVLSELPRRAGTNTPQREVKGLWADLFPDQPHRDDWIRSPADGYVWAVVTLFRSDDPSRGAREALDVVREFNNKYDGDLLVAALAQYLPSDVFDDILDLLRAKSHLQDEPFIALAKHASSERLGDLLEFAVAKWIPETEFFRAIAPRLTAQQTSAALRLCQKVHRNQDRALAFTALAPCLDAGQVCLFLGPGAALDLPRRDEAGQPLRHSIAAPAPGQSTSTGNLQGDYSQGFAVTDFLSLNYEDEQQLVIGALLDRLPEEAAPDAANRLVNLRGFDPSAYAGSQLSLFEERRGFVSVARYLSANQRRSILNEVFTVMSFSQSDAEDEAPFLARFAPLSEDEVAEAFTVLENSYPISWWPKSASMMADVLAPLVRRGALQKIRACVMAFPVEQEIFTALAALGKFQPDTARDRTAAQALTLAADVKHPPHRASAVAELAPILRREDLIAEAFEILRSIGVFSGLRAMDAMADVLPIPLLRAAVEKAVDTHASPPEYIPRILERLSEEGHTNVIGTLLPSPEGPWGPRRWEKLITALAPLLSPHQVRRLWRTWNREDSGPHDAEALSALVVRLPEHERAAAVDEVVAVYAPGSGLDYRREARTLGRLARAASTKRLTQAIDELLDRDAVKEWVLEELAPDLPEPLIEKALLYALSDDDDLSCKSLAKLAPRLSGELLNRAIAHVIEVDDLRWKAAALTLLARQLPHESEDRETVLAMTVEAAARWSWHSRLEGVMADLIPQLPERLRAQAVSAAAYEVCSDLRYFRSPGGEKFDRLHAVLGVLRGPELKQLYARLSEEVESPRVRAHAQAAVIRCADRQDAASLRTDGQPLNHDWPADYDRAGLMDLIAAAACWIYEHGEDTDRDEVIQAIFDVAHWWP
jgi:hypothetical protein